jgi:polysaccharide pyruvyl transferase WcaK-like protein
MEVSGRRTRVFVDHGEAYGNLGDEAMLISALRRLEQHLGPCTFVIPREGARPIPALEGYDVVEVPSPFAFFLASRDSRHRLEHVLPHRVRPPRPVTLSDCVAHARRRAMAARLGLLRDDAGLRRVLEVLRGCDLFYGVGAADFNDFNALGAAYKCWLYELAASCTRTVAVSAQGFGPLRDEELGRLMQRAFDRLDLLSFRDCAFSAAYTARLGNLRCATRIVADEALGLPAATLARVREYLEAAGLPADRPFIAVHWRSTDYTQETAPLFPRVAQLFESASAATGLPAVFFPMSYDVHSRHDDECCAALRRHMSDPARLLMAPVTHDVTLIKGAIGAARMTLGLSYHVHVFGLSQGVPAVIAYSGEYYRFKSEGLAGFYPAPVAAVDVQADGGIETALAAVRAIDAGHERIAAGVRGRSAELRADNDWTLREAAQRVGARRR